MRIVPQMLGGQAERRLADGEMIYRLSAPAASVVAPEGDGAGNRLAARIIDTSFGLD